MNTTPTAERQFVTVGTTGNEQLHHELNHSWDNVHGVHRSTLELKMKVFRFGKVFAHNRPLHNPVVRQSISNFYWAVWFAVCPHGRLPVGMWDEWAGALQAGASVARAKATASLRQWQALQKRPASGAAASHIRRRTPFTKVTGFRDLLR